MFLATLSVCLVSSTYIMATLVSDWHRNAPQVDSVIRQVVKDVDPEYFDLVNSEKGRKELALAYEMQGNEGGVFYINNDERSVALRDLYERFSRRYMDHISSHQLGRFDAFDRYFGKAYSEPFGRKGTLDLIFGLLFTIAGSALIDFLAVCATFRFYEDVKSRRERSLAYLPAILVCFLLSEASYITFFEGHVGTALIVLLSPLGIFPYVLACGFVIGFVASIEDVGLRCFAVSVLLVAAVVVSIAWPSTVFKPLLLAYEWYRNIAAVLAHGFSREAVLMGMMAAYPLILLLAIFVATGLCKILFSVSKTILLGQVYGASVLSGSTFFLGFLTTIITSTAVAYTVVRALLNWTAQR
ncbi:MAG: hypothetical protein JOZ96_21680 [Acidobacteria bacterium]|nr:hypothetical protein [Acidobacteriota bacterium]